MAIGSDLSMLAAALMSQQMGQAGARPQQQMGPPRPQRQLGGPQRRIMQQMGPPQPQQPGPLPPRQLGGQPGGAPQGAAAPFQSIEAALLAQRGQDQFRNPLIGAIYRDQMEERAMKAEDAYQQEMRAEKQKALDDKYNAMLDLTKMYYGEPAAKIIATAGMHDDEFAGRTLDEINNRLVLFEGRDWETGELKRLQDGAIKTYMAFGIPEDAARQIASGTMGQPGANTEGFLKLWLDQQQPGDTPEIEQLRADQLLDAQSMNQWVRLFADEMTPTVIGRVSGNPLVQAGRGVLGMDDRYAHWDKLNTKTTEDFLAFGGQVLKGNQSEKEWEYVKATRPKMSSAPQAWYTWFKDALDVLENSGALSGNEMATEMTRMTREELNNTPWLQKEDWFIKSQMDESFNQRYAQWLEGE